MNVATKVSAGSSYTSTGGPIWRTAPVGEHGDPVAQAHRLHLVVGDVDGRGADLLLEPLQLVAGAGPQLRVQVGQWLVEQEHVRLADQRPGQRHPLPLAAGQLPRLAVQQVADAEQLGRPARLALPLVGWASWPPAAGTRCWRAPSCAGRARSSGTPSRPCGPAAAGPVTTWPSMSTSPDGRLLQAGDRAQQRGLAAARTGRAGRGTRPPRWPGPRRRSPDAAVPSRRRPVPPSNVLDQVA